MRKQSQLGTNKKRKKRIKTEDTKSKENVKKKTQQEPGKVREMGNGYETSRQNKNKFIIEISVKTTVAAAGAAGSGTGAARTIQDGT